MAKKDNAYKNLNLNEVKLKLVSNIAYLSSFDIYGLEDKFEWLTTVSNTRTPSITSTIESQVDIFLYLIKDCIEQLLLITQIEGEVSETVENQLYMLEDLLEELKAYFRDRPIEKLEDRFLEVEAVSKKGDSYVIKKLACNVDRQIKHQRACERTIINLLPIINEIKANKEEAAKLKGGLDIPYLFIGRM